MIIKHKKGRHDSLPLSLFNQKLFISSLEEEYLFSIRSLYDLNNKEEQYDWNKLTGIKANFFFPMKDSVMVAWRFNLEKYQFEFAPYIHDTSGGFIRVMYEPKVILPPTGGKVKINIKIYSSQYVVTINNTVTIYDKGNPFKKGFKINSWFGGNLPAPENIEFELLKTSYVN